jgi:hypothetical protein
MKTCAFCKKEVVLDKYFSLKATCPHCKMDLHICLNCKFYSESSHNKCLETKAEFQRTRDKANFCDYFVFVGDSQGQKDRNSSIDLGDARKKFEELFKK